MLLRCCIIYFYMLRYFIYSITSGSRHKVASTTLKFRYATIQNSLVSMNEPAIVDVGDDSPRVVVVDNFVKEKSSGSSTFEITRFARKTLFYLNVIGSRQKVLPVYLYFSREHQISDGMITYDHGDLLFELNAAIELHIQTIERKLGSENTDPVVLEGSSGTQFETHVQAYKTSKELPVISLLVENGPLMTLKERSSFYLDIWVRKQ